LKLLVTDFLLSCSDFFSLRKGLITRLYQWKNTGYPVLLTEMKGHFHSIRPASGASYLMVGDIDGRDEVWEVFPSSNSAKKRVSLMGGVSTFDHHGDQFLLSSYRHGGYDIALTTKTQESEIVPISKNIKETPSEQTSVSASGFSKPASYYPFSTLFPRAWVPSAFFVPDGAQFAVWIPGFDIGQKNLYDFMGGYDTRGSPFVSLDYSYRFGSSYNLSTLFYYLPVYLISSKSFLRRWGGSIGVGGNLFGFAPKWNISLLYKKMEASPLDAENQSVGASVGLSYSLGVKTRPRGISPRIGTVFSAIHSQYFQALGSKDNYFYTYGKIEQFLEAPWWQGHAWYFALKAGYTSGTTLYNSFFQGGGEILFAQSREFFLNRGFYPGTFYGREAGTLNVEYRFPLLDIERGWSTTPFFLHRLHAALTWDTSFYESRTLYYSAGLELKSDWRLFYYLPTSIRVGAYHGFGPYGQDIYFNMGIEAGI
jgi:hypothetical protein